MEVAGQTRTRPANLIFPVRLRRLVARFTPLALRRGPEARADLRGRRAGNVHNGDISVPVDKLEPPLYATRRPATPPAGRAVKKARKMSLFNAYDDFRNYQNSLRLKAGYDARWGPAPALCERDRAPAPASPASCPLSRAPLAPPGRSRRPFLASAGSAARGAKKSGRAPLHAFSPTPGEVGWGR